MSIWKSLSSLLFAAACPLCDRSTGQFFCLDCERQLRGYQCDRPAADWQGELPIFVWGRYEGTLKRAIAALKYSAKPQIAQPLGQWLGEAWRQTARMPSCPVVPIPLHADKQQQRGYNQAALLAESFCRVTKLPIAQGLVRIRSTEAQFNLSAVDRAQNLAEAFAVNPAFGRQRPTEVLLLDDIYTTGATVRAAAACLQQQGIEVRGVIALSRPRSRPC